ncbi:hypothetical protein DV735_g4214, partial [Chaetothyriales sp. CBS 134920]
MFDAHKPNQLLAQVPLTVSPFLSLPSTVTLPYSFRHEVPSSLPPSVIDDASDKPKYIVSSSGHTAHPDDIINSSNALRQHISKTADDARKQIEAWEQSIKDRELAEKRRVAPGWLDREEKMLEPTKKAQQAAAVPVPLQSREGEEIDRAFEPFRTWHSTLVYLLLCGCLAWAAFYIGAKYAELLPTTTSPVRRQPGRNLSHSPPPPFSGVSRRTRRLNAPSPLSQVSYTPSTSSTTNSQTDNRRAGIKRNRPAWHLASAHVAIGEVSQGTIARRRSDRGD